MSDVLERVDRILVYADHVLDVEQGRLMVELEAVQKLRKKNAYNKSIGLPPVKNYELTTLIF